MFKKLDKLILKAFLWPFIATFFITLKPWHDRKKTANQIAQEVNAIAMKNISEATVIATGPPPIIGLGNGAGFTMSTAKFWPTASDRAGNAIQAG